MYKKLDKLINNSKKAKNEGMLHEYLIGRIIDQNNFNFQLKLKNVHDTPIVERIDSYKVHQKLKKEYQWYFAEKKTVETHKDFNKIVWWCWLQGLSEAPVLSKTCLNSARRMFSDYKFNIVTIDNLNNFIEIPEYIIKKYKAGIIKAATFSDIIRLMLLDKYGGLWLDATVLCTNDKIKRIVEETPCFVFKNGVLENNKDIKISSWFLSCCPGNLLVHDTKRLMLSYWKNHNFTESYYIMHLLFTLVTEKYPDLWENIPTYSNVPPHILVTELNSKFSERRFSELNNMSSVHKLNNHKKYLTHNTLYGFLLSKYKG